MLIAKVAFPVAALLLASLASEVRCRSSLTRVDHSLRARERREEQEDGYYEQCRVVDAWKEQLGRVSVLAFLDPAWQYSFRQTVMLEMLSLRLRKSGFPDIRFFAVSPSPDSTENESYEDYLEIETWRKIWAKDEVNSFVDDDFLKANETEIIFLRDDSHSRMWEKFRASRDQVIVIDRCGKLAYHVIVPWSLLFFPYVKAAILSTYMEDPCGGCDSAVHRASSHKDDHIVQLTKDTNDEEASTTQRGTNNDKFEAIWTTERLENATLHHDESEEERETAFPTLLEEIPSGYSNLLTESSTEPTTYQYNDSTTEFGESRPEDTRGQVDPVNSKAGGTVPNGTAAIFDSRPDMLPPKQAGSHPPANNSSVTPANHGNTTDRTLLLDEPAAGVTESNTTSADEETKTISDFAEIRAGNTTPENVERFEKNPLLLRIIMYAPHVHKNCNKTKKYTHLILKTGDPDYHGHFDSRVDNASPTNSWPDADSLTASSEKYDLRTMETDKEEKNTTQKYTFDVDESPGLYGELADYWKIYEDNVITDRNETSSDANNNSTTSCNEEHRTNVSDHEMCLSLMEKNHPVVNVTEDPNVEGSTDSQSIVGTNTIEFSRPINTNDQADAKEERDNLIEHYNKLLSWIDYKLSK